MGQVKYRGGRVSPIRLFVMFVNESALVPTAGLATSMLSSNLSDSRNAFLGAAVIQRVRSVDLVNREIYKTPMARLRLVSVSEKTSLLANPQNARLVSRGSHCGAGLLRR
jgi:hypothetical protein